MASPCEVHVAGGDRSVAERVLDLVSNEAWRVEDKLSRYRPDNVVYEINTAAGRTVVVDQETSRLLDYAAELFELSDGHFDITSGVLRKAWRFDGSDRVPKRATVKALLARVGWRRVRWQPPHLTLDPGMQIDFGGIGKEYAVDRAAALVGPVWTDCLLNFGGDLLALGPSIGGRPWQVGVEGLNQPALAARQIELQRGALATSGDARRYVLKNGKRYGHILDPTTGWPVAGAPRSVTVAAATCTQAGMLATFAMLRGRGAESFLDAQGVKHWCLR
ncbi:MAG TPA: FAD:protein FMN transferase [Gammaproteobacteria bacterium]|nr:FAD:protein FMN transferase [Gammaproteobacteria bacterium]